MAQAELQVSPDIYTRLGNVHQAFLYMYGGVMEENDSFL